MKLNHIDNLYRPNAQVILLFKEVYALEKIHGTAAGILFNGENNQITFQSGGERHDRFVSLFNKEKMFEVFKSMGLPPDRTMKIYGEAYAGSQQAMSHTYGKELKFIVFDVQIGNSFLSVPEAEKVAKNFELEFVDYVKVATDLALLDAERDKPSVQAIRNGITTVNPDGTLNNPKKREGVVIRPLVEVVLNNGDRVICKHKGDDFKETKSPRPVVDPSKLKVLEEATAIATEWVVPMRLEHVLGKMETHGMEKMWEIIADMVADVYREAKGEIVESDAVKKAIGQKTVELYKNYLRAQIKN